MDKQYWDKFYKDSKKIAILSNESSFAKFCQNNFFKNKYRSILELGSGSGRDANFFANHSHNVIAIDQSHEGLEFSKNLNKNLIQYIKDDFVLMDYSKYKNIDVIYSRFTLHAIRVDECDIVLNKVANCLDSGGMFAIEARSTQDPLCGKGKQIAVNTWFTDHARRFINSHELIQKNLNLGFKLLYFIEKDNLSVYKDDNPILIRAVFQKI